MYTTYNKPDLVKLAEDIAVAKKDFYDREKHFRTKERKLIKRSINRMIDEYNWHIGRYIITNIF